MAKILHEGWLKGRSEGRRWFRLCEARCLEYADQQDAENFTPVNFFKCDDPVLIPVVESRATMTPVPNTFHFRANGHFVLFETESGEDYESWIKALKPEFTTSE